MFDCSRAGRGGAGAVWLLGVSRQGRQDAKPVPLPNQRLCPNSPDTQARSNQPDRQEVIKLTARCIAKLTSPDEATSRLTPPPHAKSNVLLTDAAAPARSGCRLSAYVVAAGRTIDVPIVHKVNGNTRSMSTSAPLEIARCRAMPAVPISANPQPIYACVLILRFSELATTPPTM